MRSSKNLLSTALRGLVLCESEWNECGARGDNNIHKHCNVWPVEEKHVFAIIVDEKMLTQQKVVGTFLKFSDF